MDLIKNGFNRRFGQDVPLDIKFFHAALLGSFLASFNTLILSFISIRSYHGIILCAACCLFIAAVSLMSSLRIFERLYNIFILLFCLSINLVFFPAMYLTCGGIDSGMPIYFVLGLVFTILLLDGPALIISAVLEFGVYTALFFVTYRNLELTKIFASLGDRTYIDISLSAVMVGLVLGYVLRRLSVYFEIERARLSKLYNELEDLSTRDALTGVYNRRYLMMYLEIIMQKIKNNESQCFSIILFDIDHFKHINDTYGHIIGDEVLKSLTAILTKNLRGVDIIARYGGEEFIVVLSNANQEIAYRRAEQIRRLIENAMLNDKVSETITISGGIASYDENLTFEQLLAVADKNLYTAKETGRNKVVASPDSDLAKKPSDT